MARVVWILNHYAQEPGGPGGTRHFSLAQNLQAFGWDAALIAASTEHGTGRNRLADGAPSRLDVIDGTRFLWLKTAPYAGNGSSRLRNMLEYTWRVLDQKHVNQLPIPDVIIGSSVHPFAAWAGLQLAKRFGVPFVFEVRDLWPQTLIDMGRLKADSATARLLRRLELHLYRQASKIIVLLPRAVDYIAPLGIPAERVVWIPNGIELGSAPENPPRPEPTDVFKLMYFGAHGQANALGTVIDAMDRLQSMKLPLPVSLHLIGDGPQKQELQARATALGLTNVVFHPPVPKSEIAALAATADAFVLSVCDLPNLYRYGISMNKLFDYMAAGRPVLMASAAVNDPVADAGAGLTVPPEKPELLAEAMAQMVRLPHEDRVRMGKAGRAHVVEHYGFDRLSQRLAQTLDEACAK